MRNGGEAQRRIATFSIPNSAFRIQHSEFSIPNSAFRIQHSEFLLRFLQQDNIHWEVVAISRHPDAATEGTEGIAIVFATVLL